MNKKTIFMLLLIVGITIFTAGCVSKEEQKNTPASNLPVVTVTATQNTYPTEEYPRVQEIALNNIPSTIVLSGSVRDSKIYIKNLEAKEKNLLTGYTITDSNYQQKLSFAYLNDKREILFNIGTISIIKKDTKVDLKIPLTEGVTYLRIQS